MVTDSANRAVTNLRRQNFRIFEDKREQTLQSFACEQAPLSLSLLWDASRSMARSLPYVRAALLKLLDSLDASDETSLFAFAGRPTQVAPFSEPSTLRSRVQSVTPADGTALLDTLALAIRQSRDTRNPHRAILLFTDAADRDSRYNWKDLMRIVRESDVRVFAFLPQPWRPHDERDAALLEELANESGGRAFFTDNPDRQIEALDLRSLYMLGYAPPAHTAGKYCRVSLTLEGVNEKLRASWRRGYYAPVE